MSLRQTGLYISTLKLLDPFTKLIASKAVSIEETGYSIREITSSYHKPNIVLKNGPYFLESIFHLI